MYEYQRKRRRGRLLLAGIVAAAAAASLQTTGVAAESWSPLSIIHPSAAVARTGESYAERSADWWQRILALPTTNNPGIDTTGAKCQLGNTDGVFFLAGDFTGTSSTAPVTRKCEVPANKPLFLPPTNAECSNIEAVPFFGATAGARAECARDLVDGAVQEGFSLTLDGRTLDDFGGFRVASPPFRFHQPTANSVTGVIGVSRGLSVSDGYWVLLAPPSPGQHVIHFTSVIAFNNVVAFSQDVTYDLTVDG